MRAIKILADGTAFSYEVNNLTDEQLDILIQSNKNREGTEQIRRYGIDTAAKRKIRAAAAAQFWTKRQKYKVIFATLTIKESVKITHKQANKAVNLYLQNLKNNYGLLSYIGVHEFQKNGQSHYHFLFEVPKVDFKKINGAWNSAVSTVLGVAVISPNSVRVGFYKNGKKVTNFVQSPKHAVAYITKYLTKQNDELKDARCYFISANIRNTEITVKQTDRDFDYIFNLMIEKRIKPIYITKYVHYYSIDSVLALQLIDYYKQRTTKT